MIFNIKNSIIFKLQHKYFNLYESISLSLSCYRTHLSDRCCPESHVHLFHQQQLMKEVHIK